MCSLGVGENIRREWMRDSTGLSLGEEDSVHWTDVVCDGQGRIVRDRGVLLWLCSGPDIEMF